MNKEKSISINLTLDQLNKIMDALGKEPYVRVFELINKLQTQAQAQLQAFNNQDPEEDKTLFKVIPDESK